MNRNKAVILFFFIIFTFGFFITGSILLYLSIRDILTVQAVQKNKNTSNAIIITVSDGRRIETIIYFRVENDNELHRVNIISVFLKNIPKPKQIVQVRSSENRKLWVIDEYVNETYLAFIYRIIISVAFLVTAVFVFIKRN